MARRGLFTLRWLNCTTSESTNFPQNAAPGETLNKIWAILRSGGGRSPGMVVDVEWAVVTSMKRVRCGGPRPPPSGMVREAGTCAVERCGTNELQEKSGVMLEERLAPNPNAWVVGNVLPPPDSRLTGLFPTAREARSRPHSRRPQPVFLTSRHSHNPK